MIGLRLNLTKTMLMKNGWVSYAPFTLNGTNIAECSSYVYLSREISMMNGLAPELSRRKRAVWRAFKSIEDVVQRTENIQLRAYLFDSTVVRALRYGKKPGRCVSRMKSHSALSDAQSKGRYQEYPAPHK
ncbi:unnamed protein product [Angiostrongylus costaricensis]|uniref:Transposase n=1 Tax=Angiostrongylus costaricensis TaxID=334426 RepID=A0A0R3Q0L4_ANGCS|nr:unnamed protein product [Angiostrongylus costaricensis]